VNLQHRVNGIVKPPPLVADGPDAQRTSSAGGLPERFRFGQRIAWGQIPGLEDSSEENLYTIMGTEPIDPIVLSGSVLSLELVATLTYPLPACHSVAHSHGADSFVKESTSPGSVNLTSAPPSALDHH